MSSIKRRAYGIELGMPLEQFVGDCPDCFEINGASRALFFPHDGERVFNASKQVEENGHIFATFLEGYLYRIGIGYESNQGNQRAKQLTKKYGPPQSRSNLAARLRTKADKIIWQDDDTLLALAVFPRDMTLFLVDKTQNGGSIKINKDCIRFLLGHG